MARQFGKHAHIAKLSPQQAARQGSITKAAIAGLGAPGAIAFLNGHDALLGGRPLDLAIESAEGLIAVERALLHRTEA
ncbi:hypothetical protein [Sphingobium baderi]|uniref:Antitoxin Xre/MbcA/ParS-like toxin-binding domain-containing protein n=1 Tax=Sphingobium baderi TaxID=1332080 RepID=A0A0S3EZ24_9SPHN|nr:hypothetical protein [Sphingobium baderi]ALR20671.1 hypothetical protein ATN00_10545 [Sphingobium baderi]